MHTPGPWTYDKGREDKLWDRHEVYAGAETDPDPIALVLLPNGELSGDMYRQAHGNGYLIAAAPDMEAVCQMIVSATVGSIPPGIVDAARKALEKARS